MIPNPGSHEAKGQGCLCPVFDNYHGAGLYTDDEGKTQFVIVVGCPLHDPSELGDSEQDLTAR